MLTLAAMVSVEVARERFSRLKEVESRLKNEVEGGKDQLIEVNCLDA